MSAPAKNPARFVETRIEDETVVMLLATGDFFSLRDSAAAIWHLIDGSRDEAQIAAELAAVYDAAPADLAPDVAAFVDELRGAGLLAGE